jgi:hypothetical protein
MPSLHMERLKWVGETSENDIFFMLGRVNWVREKRNLYLEPHG